MLLHEVLANPAMVMQDIMYLNVLNQQVARLKFTRHYMSIISQLERPRKGSTHTHTQTHSPQCCSASK